MVVHMCQFRSTASLDMTLALLHAHISKTSGQNVRRLNVCFTPALCFILGPLEGVILFRLLLKQAGTPSLGVGRCGSSANMNNYLQNYKLCFRFTRISTQQDIHNSVLSMIA